MKLPDTIPLGTAVMLVAREHANRLAADYPEGDPLGQARAAVNTALVNLGVDVGLDWQELERLAQHRAWSRAVVQGADASPRHVRNPYTGHEEPCGCHACATSRAEA